MELWDIYDENRAVTGRYMVRGEPIAPGDRHLVVSICVFNSRGQMLIQRRQPFKSGWSGYWDISAGGAAVRGDDSRSAAHRELWEEIGLDVDFSGLTPQLTMNSPEAYQDIYLIHQDVDADSLTLQKEEVAAVRWAAREEIHQMIDSGVFIPYYHSLIDLLFSMRHGYGLVQRQDS